MTDPTIRVVNSLMMLKLQSSEGVPVACNPAQDAFPFEIDSVEFSYPFAAEDTNEVTGSFVKAAPTIIGQPFTAKFKARMKGIGAGLTYSATVKPPHHALLQACGMRGNFQAAIPAIACTAGSSTSATLGNSFAATLQALRYQRLILSGGVGAGAHPVVIDYTAGRVATLSDSFTTPLDTTTQASVNANWTYVCTSPVDLAARLTDQPPASWEYYEDGIKYSGYDMRGSVAMDGSNAKAGFFTFTMKGIWGGQVDAALPTGAVYPQHGAPVLTQGTGVSGGFIVNRKPLPISTWAIGGVPEVETLDDPNSPYGFTGGIISGIRGPELTFDPLKTQLATRNHLAEFVGGGEQSAVIRCGTVSGNRWAISGAAGVPSKLDPGKRGNNRSENFALQFLNKSRDNLGRDGDWGLCFD